jgi:hypothetical protein
MITSEKKAFYAGFVITLSVLVVPTVFLIKAVHEWKVARQENRCE